MKQLEKERRMIRLHKIIVEHRRMLNKVTHDERKVSEIMKKITSAQNELRSLK